VPISWTRPPPKCSVVITCNDMYSESSDGYSNCVRSTSCMISSRLCGGSPTQEAPRNCEGGCTWDASAKWLKLREGLRSTFRFQPFEKKFPRICLRQLTCLGEAGADAFTIPTRNSITFETDCLEGRKCRILEQNTHNPAVLVNYGPVGHSNILMTMKCVHSAPEHKQEAIGNFERISTEQVFALSEKGLRFHKDPHTMKIPHADNCRKLA